MGNYIKNSNKLITFFVNEDGKRVKLTVSPAVQLHDKLSIEINRSGSVETFILSRDEALHLNVIFDKYLIQTA